MKKQRFISLMVMVILLSSSLACIGVGPQVRGRGNVVERDMPIRGKFTGVDLMTSADLYIEEGDEVGLRIEAQENLIAYFVAEVDGDTLEIKTKPNTSLRYTKPVKFYLTVKDLDSIKLSGSGNIYGPDLDDHKLVIDVSGSGDLEVGDMEADQVHLKISGSGGIEAGECEAEDFEITVSGSGTVRIEELKADTLEVEVSGSGNIDIFKGRVDEQKLYFDSSGDYSAKNLKSERAEVRLSGSSRVMLWVEDTLDVTISGSGDVRYAGNPEVNKIISGSGDVIKVGD